MKKIVFLAALFLIVALAWAEEPQKKTVIATADKDGVQRVSVLGGEYFFNPAVIVVKVNVPVELLAAKEGGITPHNFTMDSPEAGMKFDVSLSKEPTPIKFTPAKKGRFPFFCTKKLLFAKSHREKGMEGIIEVVE